MDGARALNDSDSPVFVNYMESALKKYLNTTKFLFVQGNYAFDNKKCYLSRYA